MPTIQRSRSKVILLFIGTVIFYNEFLSYTLHSLFKWPSLSCEDRPGCLKFVFVADPQIVGERFEPGFPFGSLARWDCDRFLSKTFHRVVSYMDPDVVIFLGDLMDEGSIATKQEYARYTRRFFNIFETDYLIQYIYIPGDNDIGGEDEDRLTNGKLKRYDQTFNQPDSFRYQTADIYKVNRLTFSMPRNISAIPSNRTNIVLTHLPLLFLPNQFVHKIIRQIRPQIIFSAHDHKSLHTSVDTEMSKDVQIIEMLQPTGGPIWEFQTSKSVIHEIMVPTCSYRMGVADVGYGAAILDSTGALTYTVFWSPSRFAQLGAYVAVLIVLALYWLSLICCCVYTFIRMRLRCSKVKHMV